jgi:hypothetical protein
MLPDTHHMPLHVHQRTGGSFHISSHYVFQQASWLSSTHANGIGNGIHGSTTQERNLGQRHSLVHIQEACERDMVGAISTADAQDIDL